MRVRLELFDSRPGTVSMSEILTRAQQIIRNSGWLDENRSTTEVPYTITSFPKRVPHQVGENSCALHVILNAWAVILDIPIQATLLRRGRIESDKFDVASLTFLRQGFNLVNLALEGYMDSVTIYSPSAKVFKRN